MTRQELQMRRATMLRTLRQRCQQGELRAGTLVASKRQLAEEFGVSATVAGQVVQELVEDRLFYTIPRSGTYVGPRQERKRELYVAFAGDEPTSFSASVRTGFEDGIAALGGSVILLTRSQVDLCAASHSFPDMAGVLEWGYGLEKEVWPNVCDVVPARVCYSTLPGEAGERDSVAFDDVDGGRQATEHLLQMGHRGIAFLGLHQEHKDDEKGPAWSRLRENGWRQAMDEAGLSTQELSFPAQRKTTSNSHPEHVEVARAAAQRLVQRPDIDAVVTANDRAAQALLEELKKNVTPKLWPSIVSFDNDPQLQSEAVTSLRLPWEEIGKAAAEQLWARSHGELEEAPQHRLVRMKLIPRLTCRPDWTRMTLDDSIFEHLTTSRRPARVKA